jgi:hypothetical protein
MRHHYQFLIGVIKISVLNVQRFIYNYQKEKLETHFQSYTLLMITYIAT